MNEGFWEKLILAIVDKGVLAIIAAYIGYLISRKLETIKKDNSEFLNEVKSASDKKLEEQKARQSEVLEAFKSKRTVELEKLKSEHLRQLEEYKNENNKRLGAFSNEQARLNKLAEQTQDLKNELQKQRDTRAFDKRLDWYERTIRALHDMAQKIEIASTFEEEKKEPEEEKKKEHRIRCWRDVQRAHLNLSTLSDEARIYGTEEAAIQTERIIKKVDDVAYESEAFEPEFAAENLKLIDTLPIKLRKAATPLAKEARTHLGLD